MSELRCFYHGFPLCSESSYWASLCGETGSGPVDEVTLVALLGKSPPNFVPYSNHFLLLPDSVGSDVGGAQQGTWFLPPCVCTSAGGLRGCWGQSRPSLVHSFLVPGLVRSEIQSLHVASACYWVSLQHGAL